MIKTKKPMIRKSSMYYTGAAAAALMSLVWSSFVFLGGHAFYSGVLKYIPFPLNPYIGFIGIFIAIFLIRKAFKFNNLEKGRPANTPIKHRRIHTVMNVAGISICILLVIAFIVKNVQTGHSFLD